MNEMLNKYQPVLNTEHKSVKALLDTLKEQIEIYRAEVFDSGDYSDIDTTGLRDCYCMFMNTHSKLSDALGFEATFFEGELIPGEAMHLGE